MKDQDDFEKELESLRKEINEIDFKIVELLNSRGKVIKGIGKIKKELDLDTYQPKREEEVLQKVIERSETLPAESIRAIWKEIMSASKRIQGRIDRIGYLGPEGTFTHQAALEFFPKSGSKFIPSKNIIEIFENIEKNMLDYGVIPIENSLQGTVRETLDLLIEKELMIFGEIELRIKQNLIGVDDADLSKIQKIYSHPQAFAQTRSWLKANLPNCKLINANSTAEAVKIIKEKNDKKIGAIGTEFAAKVHDLKLLSSNIEDNPSNYTRFLIVADKENKVRDGRIKTSIVYVTKHIPGALYNVLELFAKAEINLLKIESRPRRKGRWEYIFLMDFEGDKNDPKIQSVIKNMEKNVIWYKILGSYPMF
ncbi:MAG: prephenate dehydratase [Candidatus Lokiarchaeota archaeon]|nr:prephenate dehydratase [Candidatus Lokiarchaeota archaeon]